ncbi:hypothetical protein HYT56_01815 [Candidatus Woesearchaeota archaeon]|nr:hypothetical protein [Candidatus Woesearchaeota archaeon]
MPELLLEKAEEQTIYLLQLNEALTFHKLNKFNCAPLTSQLGLQEENRAQKKEIEDIKKSISVSAQQQKHIDELNKRLQTLENITHLETSQTPLTKPAKPIPAQTAAKS